MPARFISSGESVYTKFEIEFVGCVVSSNVRLTSYRLDSEQVLLVGDFYESEDAYLRGRVIFNNNTTIKVTAIRLCLIGDHRVCFPNPRTHGGSMLQEGRFYKQESVLLTSAEAGPSLKPGNHEWPFEILIKGYRMETLQGLSDTFLSYKLRVIVERGAFAKDLKAYKPVRLVRTYDPTSLALNQSVSMDRLWPEKIKYTFSTPSKAVVFGSTIPCELAMVPLVKGVKIGKIAIALMELQEYHFMTETNPTIRRDPYEQEIEILSDVYKVPQDMETTDIDGLEGYVFHRQIPVPRELAACRLSRDSGLSHGSDVQLYPLVRVIHWLKIVITLLNADGHVSEIRSKLAVCIFLTPNQRLDAKNKLINAGAVPMGNNSDVIANEFGAPPSYGQHVTDETLNIGRNNGFSTPSLLESSRTSSTNLQDLNGDDQISANTLRNRLSSLINPLLGRSVPDESDQQSILPRILTTSNGGSSPNENSRGYSGRLRINNGNMIIHHHNRYTLDSSMPSGLPSGAQTPAHIEYDTIALSRVPSYATASRSGPPRDESYVELPTYNQSTSRSASRSPSPELATSWRNVATQAHQPGSGDASIEAERPRRVRYTSETHI